MTTTATADKPRGDLLRKVQGLIDTADSLERGGNSAAAASYRAKADQLMTDYAVESFELAMAAEAKDARAGLVPEVRVFDLGDVPYEIQSTLGGMFHSLATHTRCMVVGGVEGNYRAKRVIGFPVDLDYLEILFVSLRLDMSSKLAPQPVEGDFGASLAARKRAGDDWFTIFTKLRDAFPGEFADCHDPCVDHAVGWYAMRERSYAGSDPACAACQANGWVRYADTFPYRAKARMSKRYATWCKANDEQQVKDAPQVWARSFVQGYTSEIRSRLAAMRDATQTSDSAALVLADRDAILREAFYELRPEARPHPLECECDSCHLRKCTQRATCKRECCVQARKPIPKSHYRYVTYSHRATQAGRAAGATADLTGRGRRVGGSPKGEIK